MLSRKLEDFTGKTKTVMLDDKQSPLRCATSEYKYNFLMIS